MKRLISLSLFLSSALCSHAQDVNKTLTLDEVTVQAAKVVNKADGLLVYPTNAQKQGSNNGFSILEKLSLANLRIDHVNHAVTAIDNRGEVQLRVNGVVVGKQEMLALDPKDVVKIDFINNPGVRYGEGIAYVVDIVTRRSESGYTVGTDLTASLTTLQADGMVYGKWNRGKSEHCRVEGHGRHRPAYRAQERTLGDAAGGGSQLQFCFDIHDVRPKGVGVALHGWRVVALG